MLHLLRGLNGKQEFYFKKKKKKKIKPSSKCYKKAYVKIILWKKTKRKPKTNNTVSDQAVDCGFFQTLQVYGAFLSLSS